MGTESVRLIWSPDLPLPWSNTNLMTEPKAPPISPRPLALRSGPWPDYELLDSGEGRKLERFGEVRLVRPEPQAMWRPSLPRIAWSSADAVFEGAEEDERGKWRRAQGLPEAWTLRWGKVAFETRLTAFRHVGVFPEQAANWEWIAETLGDGQAGARVLNLFGYTGVASLVAASVGAEVTHVDASRKSVAWARDNSRLSGLETAPMRWVTEDARAYARREMRRGSRYTGVILDPPKYGRGPDGEVWRLYDDLSDLLQHCAAVLADDARFVLVNAYSERLTGLALAGLLAQAMVGRGGVVDWGELVLMERAQQRGVGMSFFARWRRR